MDRTISRTGALIACSTAAFLSSACAAAPASDTATPVKHLIVVVGENVSFDTLFATHVPRPGESIRNLLSEEIIQADGSPGRNYPLAVQSQAQVEGSGYSLSPRRTGPYTALPQPTLIGIYDPATLKSNPGQPDPRFAGFSANGPFPITKFVPYGTKTSQTGDPVHRFFQMWQQTGGTNHRLDLWAWVAVNVGTGGATGGVSPGATGQGAELMGFYNMQAGDAPYFRALAQEYAISDNYHQAVMGGTGANFFSLATGDLPVYRSGGQLAVPPQNQIENPDRQPGTADFYINDGYSGGSYVRCDEASQPGVGAILRALERHGRRSNCAPGAYYLVNNYTPPFTIDGAARALGSDQFVYPPQAVPTIGEDLSAHGVSWAWFTGGRDVADVTSDPVYGLVYPGVYQQVFAAVQAQFPPGTAAAVIDATAAPIARAKAIPIVRGLVYNDIGDPHNASENVVNGPLKANLKGLASFYGAVAGGSLPAVSFVVPNNIESGHPGYSVLGAYEAFVADLVQRVRDQPALWADTAIVITTDESGGYFDSGAIQNLDFFGDGPRIPLLVVSPWARRGHVDHVYSDHASILKFIERNWRLPPVSARSRDNLRNPDGDGDGYLPGNGPAIGDLMSLFEFPEGSPDRR